MILVLFSTLTWFVRLCRFNPSRRLWREEEEEEEEAKCSDDLVRTWTSAHRRSQICPWRLSLRKVQYIDTHTDTSGARLLHSRGPIGSRPRLQWRRGVWSLRRGTATAVKTKSQELKFEQIWSLEFQRSLHNYSYYCFSERSEFCSSVSISSSIETLLALK